MIKVSTTFPMSFISDCANMFSVVNREVSTMVINSYMPKFDELPLIAINGDYMENKTK